MAREKVVPVVRQAELGDGERGTKNEEDYKVQDFVGTLPAKDSSRCLPLPVGTLPAKLLAHEGIFWGCALA